MEALVGLAHAGTQQASNSFAERGCLGPTGKMGEVPAVGADRVRRASLAPALDQPLNIVGRGGQAGPSLVQRQACRLGGNEIAHTAPAAVLHPHARGGLAFRTSCRRATDTAGTLSN